MGAEKDEERLSALLNQLESADTEMDVYREAVMSTIDAAAGSWEDRDFDGEQYVERLRPGNDEGAASE